MEIKTRKEFDVVPQGASITETEDAVYLRFREADAIITLRVPRENFYLPSVSIDKVVSIDGKDWHGVWGIKDEIKIPNT
jgi:hypothetical protein